MSGLDPASARLVPPSSTLVDAYVKGRQAGERKPLPSAVLEMLTQSTLRGYMTTGDTQRFFYQQLWMVAGEAVIGSVALRPQIKMRANLATGHIAYEIFSGFRGRGFGHRALALAIAELRNQGIGDLLLLCEEDNVASIRIITAAGGLLERMARHPDFPDRRIRRYWIKQ